ncbi:MAG: transcription antitermination factor NusB, partial [Fuerstiella sp.]
ALQMLYLVDQNPDTDLHWVRKSLEEQLDAEASEGEPLVDFAWSLIIGVREHRAAIDEQITAVAQNWRVDRMAPTDRNAIRMGFFELHYLGTPAAVVLNETIELAREFGTEQSSSFVNGVLDKLTSVNPAGPVG